MKLVKYRVADGIAIVALASGPVNATTQALRAALSDVFDRISRRDDIIAVALTGEGVTFSAGNDFRSPEDAAKAPVLSDLCNQIENCSVPVVAGLHGSVLSGGFEIAMACHYRIAAPAVHFALPEVTLGTVSSAGATQRLPRLAGLGIAMDMLLQGKPIGAEAAKANHLIDGVINGNVQAATIRFAQAIAAAGKPVRRTKDMPVKPDGRAYFAAIKTRRAVADSSPLIAPKAIVDSLEAAAMMPFDIGLAFEQGRAEDVQSDPQFVALRRLFLAERRISERLIYRDAEARKKLLGADGETIVARMKTALKTAQDAMLHSGTSQQDIENGLAYFGLGSAGSAAKPAVGDQLLGALVAEGARLIHDGVAERAAEIDVVAVFGLGFNRWMGGPMQAAQSAGLLHLRNQMREWSANSPVWAVPPLMEEAVKYASGFDGLVLKRAG